MQSWRIGETLITRVEESLAFANMPPVTYFRGFDREFFLRHLDWLVPNHYAVAENRIVSSVHSWLVRTPRHTILVDSCAGNHKPRPWTPRFHQLDTSYFSQLRAIVDPDSIDFVCCTHLHADHVGWNTRLADGRWVPTFKNAKYIFARSEYEYWNPELNAAMSADPRRPAFEDSVLPVILTGQGVLVEDGYDVDEVMRIVSAPGHTPGHSLFDVKCGGEKARLCGDAIHHPIQILAPHWNHMADEDPDMAETTRMKMLTECAETGALLFPTHFGAPHVARIKMNATAFSFEFVEGRRLDR